MTGTWISAGRGRRPPCGTSTMYSTRSAPACRSDSAVRRRSGA
jgi:hypothetical protein